MQRIKRAGVVIAAVVAASALMATAASSTTTKLKTLEIKKSGGGALSSSETVIAVWEFTVGTEKCRNEMTGNVTVNNSKTDTFTGKSGIFKCGEFAGIGEESGSATFTFGANGKAGAGSVSLAIGTCKFTGAKFKGTNTTSGHLSTTVSGKLKANKGCKTKTGELKTVTTEFEGPEEKFLQVS